MNAVNTRLRLFGLLALLLPLYGAVQLSLLSEPGTRVEVRTEQVPVEVPVPVEVQVPVEVEVPVERVVFVPVPASELPANQSNSESDEQPEGITVRFSAPTVSPGGEADGVLAGLVAPSEVSTGPILPGPDAIEAEVGSRPASSNATLSGRPPIPPVNVSPGPLAGGEPAVISPSPLAPPAVGAAPILILPAPAAAPVRFTSAVLPPPGGAIVELPLAAPPASEPPSIEPGPSQPAQTKERKPGGEGQPPKRQLGAALESERKPIIESAGRGDDDRDDDRDNKDGFKRDLAHPSQPGPQAPALAAVSPHTVAAANGATTRGSEGSATAASAPVPMLVSSPVAAPSRSPEKPLPPATSGSAQAGASKGAASPAPSAAATSQPVKARGPQGKNAGH